MSSSAITGPVLSDVRRAPAGTAAAPSFAFNDSTGTGVYLVSAGVLGLSTAGVQRVVVDASGNVGIGTASPGTKAEVYSNTYPDFQLKDNAGRVHRLAINSDNANPKAAFISDSPWTFQTVAGTERMRLDASGNLLVGTTSSQARLTTWSSSGNAARFYNNFSNVGAPTIYVDKQDNNTTTSNVFVQFTINSQGAGSGQINANGANSAAFGSFSDRRLKENIQDLPSQLTNIMALRPVEFDYIESEGGGHQIGFVAQEMQEIYPDAVGERAPDGMLTITGWSKTEARLVKAIQEQQEIIGKLEARLAALESK